MREVVIRVGLCALRSVQRAAQPHHVVDAVRAREAGDFNFQCLWRVLGKPTLEGNVLRAEQVAKGDIEFVPSTAAPDRECALFHTQDGALEFTVELPAGKCALAVFGRRSDVMRIGSHSAANHFGVNFCPAFQSVFQFFKNKSAGSLA